MNLLAIPFPMLALDAETYGHAESARVQWTIAGDRSRRPGRGREHAQHAPVLGRVALLPRTGRSFHSHSAAMRRTTGRSATGAISVIARRADRLGGERSSPPAGSSGEVLIAAILGKIDAIEVTGEPRKVPLLPWVYRLWDAGFLVPLVGASGKDSNRIALGRTRTYARLEGETWVEAVRAGRTVATEGPLLVLEQKDGQVRAGLRSGSSAGRVEIVANGRMIAAGEGGPEAVPTGPGWVPARCHASAAASRTSPLAVGGGVKGGIARGAG